MAVTYDKIAYDEVEHGLKKVIDNEFNNVYIGNTFKMIGTECIRIDLISSESIEQATNYEQREYALIVRYYHKADTSQEIINKSVKGKIDRLRKHLLDNQVNTTNKWSALIINNIIYNVQDEENEDEKNLHIAEFDIGIQHYNHFN
jgi:serine protease inhibitor